MKALLSCLVITYLICSVSSTINPSKNKKGKQKSQTAADVKINKGPQLLSVYDRNLVDNEPLASDIVAEANTYYKERSVKNFNGTLLGYVTPVSQFARRRNFSIKIFLVELSRLRRRQNIRTQVQHYLACLAADSKERRLEVRDRGNS